MVVVDAENEAHPASPSSLTRLDADGPSGRCHARACSSPSRHGSVIVTTPSRTDRRRVAAVPRRESEASTAPGA